MFCSSCGAAVPPGLSFCNRCGADLRVKEQISAPPTRSGPYPDSLVWGIVAVTTVGLCAVVALMVIMKEVLHFSDGPITGFAAATFVSFILVDVLFAWLLMSSKRAQEKSFDAAELKAEVARALTDQPIQSLPEARQSVTEQTTRTLDAVPRNRQG